VLQYISMPTPEFYFSRRKLLKSSGVLLAASLLSACGDFLDFSLDEPATPTPHKVKIEILPTSTPEFKKYKVEEKTNLVDIAEERKVPAVDGDDYYLWYRWNQDLLFDPWKIPYGTELIIPDQAKEPPKLPEILTPAEGWTYSFGEMQTKLSGSSANRRKNIARAVELINNRLIEPYKLFSVNQAVGPVSRENGYVEGFGYLDNREVPTIGGGVCQIPSTLFKAALEAGMLVPQRIAHMFYSERYLPGFDATISDTFDLTIRNLCNFPFQIRVKIDPQKDTLVASLWAPNPLPYKFVEVETVINNEVWNDGKIHAQIKQSVGLLSGRIRTKYYDSQYSIR